MHKCRGKTPQEAMDLNIMRGTPFSGRFSRKIVSISHDLLCTYFTFLTKRKVYLEFPNFSVLYISQRAIKGKGYHKQMIINE